ncbi:hypothetical protein BHM03_00053630 [Ensete ventricosum]|nr:hypothetical protein BHM03_00053630 [Ensete ventricosum]
MASGAKGEKTLVAGVKGCYRESHQCREKGRCQCRRRRLPVQEEGKMVVTRQRRGDGGNRGKGRRQWKTSGMGA